jgi:hypothetical protein
MKKVLLTIMFVLSLFIMCGCGEGHRHGDRHSERWEQERHSEQPGTEFNLKVVSPDRR